MNCCLKLAVAVMAMGSVAAIAQQPETPESNRKVAGGGITVAGWQGQVDANAAKAGQSVKDALFEQQGKAIHVVTGPATTYWNPKNVATGDYTVSATFHEPKYMNLNDHPHPYGIVIGGADLGTEKASYLYCAAYGNGNFIVRGFGPEPFQMNGRRGGTDEAVHKAAGPGSEVQQEIAMQVKGDTVSCIINGKSVWSAPKSEVVAAGKLKSTDGVYGVRSAHNTEVHVIGLAKK